MNINQLSWAPLPSRALPHGDSCKQILEEAKVYFSEVQFDDLVFSLAPFQGPELQHLVVTAAKAAFDLHIPSDPLLDAEYEVQQSTSLWPLCHKGQEAVSALQKPPALLVPCCVVFFFFELESKR